MSLPPMSQPDVGAPPPSLDQIASAAPAPKPHSDMYTTIRDLYEAFQNGQMTNQLRFHKGKEFIYDVLSLAINEPQLDKGMKGEIILISAQTGNVKAPMPNVLIAKTEGVFVARFIDEKPEGNSDEAPFEHFNELTAFVLEKNHGEKVDQLRKLVAETAVIAMRFGYLEKRIEVPGLAINTEDAEEPDADDSESDEEPVDDEDDEELLENEDDEGGEGDDSL